MSDDLLNLNMEEVLKAFANKDEAAIESFIHTITPHIQSIAAHFDLHRQNIADITQESLFKVCKAIHSFDLTRKFEPWLYTIVKHESQDAAKREINQRHKKTASFEDADIFHAQNVIDHTISKPVDQLIHKEEQQHLLTIAEHIKEHHPRAYAAFEQTKIEGHSGEEAAKILGISPSGVFLQTHRFKQLLRERIAESMIR